MSARESLFGGEMEARKQKALSRTKRAQSLQDVLSAMGEEFNMEVTDHLAGLKVLLARVRCLAGCLQESDNGEKGSGVSSYKKIMPACQW
jgi:hypothetical protein